MMSEGKEKERGRAGGEKLPGRLESPVHRPQDMSVPHTHTHVGLIVRHNRTSFSCSAAPITQTGLSLLIDPVPSHSVRRKERE